MNFELKVNKNNKKAESAADLIKISTNHCWDINDKKN